MPELPEVETIRRGLEQNLAGKRIISIEVRYARIFQGDAASVLDAQIVGVRRFGKGLVIDFANDMSIVAHVKMTGQFVYQSNQKGTSKSFHPRLSLPEELPHKHTHVIFSLKDHENGLESRLFFNDIRKFGWIKILKSEDVHTLSFFKSLGKELPLKDLAGNLSVDEFLTILSLSHAPIKSVLMDQQKIAGVGNIYANDALFLAGIDPRRKADSIEESEAKLLYKSLIEVLEKGLLHGGASEVNYVHVDGGKGQYQNHFLVYGRSNEKCPVCGALIERIVVGGRGTFYCPACQQ